MRMPDYRMHAGIPGPRKKMEKIWQDMRYAARMLTKSPGFTALAVLMLAIGIGINTTVFTIFDCVLVRSIPAKDPKQLVHINARKQGEYKGFSYSDYQDIRRQNTSFLGIAAVHGHYAMVDRSGDIEMISSESVSEDYFSVLGIDLLLGQPFVRADQWRSGDAPPVIISHSLWQRRFGGDPAIVGKTMLIQQRHAVIRGVAPKSYAGVKSPMITDLWLPASAWEDPRNLAGRENRYTEQLMARLRPGIGIETARAELNTIAQRLALAFPATNQGISYNVSYAESDIIDTLKYASLILACPLLILIICCANVSAMMLARAEERRSEIAVRLALGSGRRILLRQLMTESLLLAFLGAVCGSILTFWLVKIFPALIPPLPVEIRLNLRMDTHVFLFAIGVSMAASFISGLAPALHAMKANLVSPLKGMPGKAEGKRPTLGLRSILVTGQVALSLVLLVSTGLFLKSLLFTERIDPGFDPQKKLLLVNYIPYMGPRESSQGFFLPVIEQIKSIPGVKGASYAFRMLMSASGGGRNCELSIPGVEPPKGQNSFVIKCNSVGRDYFQTVGTRILRGRAFNRYDETPDRRTIIINETMAQRFWPKADPIGRRVTAQGKDYEIVGVAQNNMEDIHATPEPYLYSPFAQVPMAESVIIVETAGDPMKVVGAVKEKIRRMDKTGVMLKPGTLDDLMSIALIKDRLLFYGTAFLGILGILLASTGLYAVIAYLARRRSHEIGIRMALGAQRGDISRLIVKRGFRLGGIGITAGLLVSYFIMQLLAGMLYGVAPTDIWTFLSSAAAVLLISLLASYIPARSAAKADPMISLRNE